MKKLSKKEQEKIAIQMGVTSRKSLEERGRFPRPVIFKDRKKEARKYACRQALSY